MAEFMRALRMLEVLQAEQAACAIDLPASTPAVQVSRRAPNEPKRRATPRLDYVMPCLPIPFPPLHEPAAPWVRNRPESGRRRAAGDSGGRRTNPKPASIGAS